MKIRDSFLLSVLLFAAACTVVGRDYKAPKTDAPAAWREESSPYFASTAEGVGEWWRRLDDATLESLVDRALASGLDVQEAMARVRESRALRGVSGSERFPTLDAGASYQRVSQSQNSPLGIFVPDSDLYAAGFDASWEVDLWGRVRRSVEAADADLQAHVEDARDVLVSLAAETAINYVELRAFQKRLEIARTNVELQEETLRLVRGRFESGLVRERDVAQAATNVESTRSHLPELEVGVRTAENRLAVLIGEPPGALAAELEAARPIPVAPRAVAVGVPADALRRRPDVRRAERVLAAETARIGVAEGELYPKLSLVGNIGLVSSESSNLFERASGVFSFGPSVRWNVFDAGRRRNEVAAQDARTDQALARWRRTVLSALEETENAMTAFAREHERRDSLSEAARQARLAVDLAKSQYEQGLTDFQAVLDSERALALLDDELARSDSAITTDLIRLYKSLGGGFAGTDERVAAALDARATSTTSRLPSESR
jgi:NodT family efflux transporter outer membrane factor (OMF) lipoprotein